MRVEPSAPDPDWPRYTARPFPAYRYVPGRRPHPVRDPAGHSFGAGGDSDPAFDPARWHDDPDYLFGIDLYNFAYWWECHEVLERPWTALTRDAPERPLLEGLIQVAAANLKRFQGEASGAERLSARGLAKLRGFEVITLGIDVPAFVAEADAYFAERRRQPALIRLTGLP